MTLDELKKNLELDLDKQFVTSAILDNLMVINEDTRKTSSYVDSRYLPFYYYLGKYLKPKNLLEIGFGLGFTSTCFLRSFKGVENFLAFQEKKEFFSPKIGLKNVRHFYKGNFGFYEGKITDSKFEKVFTQLKWDLVLVNDEKDYDKQLFTLETVWNQMSLDGYLVVDRLSSETNKLCFSNFCKMHNVEPVVLPTRYTTGIIQR